MPAVPAPVDEVAFIIEVRSMSGRPYARTVTLTVTALEADGEIAEYIDKSGVPQPGPKLSRPTTPWKEIVWMGPGIARVSISVIYLGLRGEFLSCYVEKNGLEVRGSRNEQQVTSHRKSGQGEVLVVCTH